MKLNREIYRDKVRACFVGKNIGGTMGTPYEGERTYNDIKGFVTPPGVVLPNDDLDLQLVWLHAVEQIGPYNLTANKLGEFWLSFITPYWNEYGIGKENLKHGLQAPLSGDYKNDWNNSNGAWIRTEVWATMCPGCPAAAATYAAEDAKVDHGSGEGTIAAAFVAAMQAAAFVINDLRTCIDIGLNCIPETSRMADSIRYLLEIYDKGGYTPFEAREAIRLRNADIGDGWFEAPSNVTYSLLGMLWGKCDFKQSMIIAINCGDDTDCTGATVGATLGILYGMKGVPEDWASHIGDAITTISLAGGYFYTAPKTVTELSKRVERMAPCVLIANTADVEFTDGESEIPEDIAEEFLKDKSVYEKLCALKPYMVTASVGYMSVDISFPDGIDIVPGEEKKMVITYRNADQVKNGTNPHSNAYGNSQRFVSVRFLSPEGFTVDGKKAIRIPDRTSHSNGFITEEYTIHVPENIEASNRIVFEAVSEGRSMPLYLSFLLLA